MKLQMVTRDELLVIMPGSENRVVSTWKRSA